MILNFGSLNIDHVYQVERFVKPGETILCRSYEVYAGGKGLNQSVAAGRAGGQVRHAGRVGVDGRFLIDILHTAGVDTSLVQTTNARNGHTSIQVDQSGQNSIVLYPGTNHLLDEQYAALVSQTLEKGDIVLFQNETTAIAEMMKLASARGCRIALNPSPMDQSIFQLPLELVDIFILNEIEGAALSGLSGPADILDYLAFRFPKAKILLTLGEEGVRFAYGETRVAEGIFRIGPPIDTTAAGDTFTGYYLAACSQGADDRTALRKASAAAGLCVTRAGAAQSIPLAGEVEEILNRK